MEKKTPLYTAHQRYGGKIVPFAGYLLPVQYEKGVIAEHLAVRNNCGLFDVSHMGEFTLNGQDALKNLNYLLTNDYSVMYDGQARYSPMCNDEGGVVDDLIVYKIRDDNYFIVVNAANKDKDFNWIEDHLFGDVQFDDVSEKYAQLALQGPKSEDILRKLTTDDNIPKKYYSAVFEASVQGMNCIISKTGYTGENGFEIYIEPDHAIKLWDELIEAGKDEGLIPCGLGARDTLRLEAAMPLYGHEMNDSITPLETGLGFFVKLDKPDFIGKKAIIEKGQPKVKRVGLEIIGRGVAREGCRVFADGNDIGFVTSGTHCPYIGKPIAMALIDKSFSEAGTEVSVEIRGKQVPARVIGLPFYKKK